MVKFRSFCWVNSLGGRPEARARRMAFKLPLVREMRRKPFIAGGLFGFGLAIGLATVGTYGSGYLTKVGPTVLRFQPPPRAVVPLPPLPTEEPPVVESTPAPNPFQFTPTLTLMTDIVLSVLADRGLINTPATNSLLPDQAEVFSAVSYAAPRANDWSAVSPQMFVEFFRPTPGFTNGGGASVSVPVEFMPATPAQMPASRATYKAQ